VVPGSQQNDSAPGSAQRSTVLAGITAALAADLAMLTDALDLAGTDIGNTLQSLVTAAGEAVGSYLGLRVAMTVNGAELEISTLQAAENHGHIRASLAIPSSPGSSVDGNFRLVLYAETAGAFVDLAADLAWLTDRPLADFRLDDDLVMPPASRSPSALTVLSTVNQALGILIGRGHTPEAAERYLDVAATRAAADRYSAARLIVDDPDWV
jgi:hypothetical protein